MPPIVKLEDIVEALDFPDEWEVFLDPESGKIITVTEDDRMYLESDDLEGVPDWQQESIAAAQRALDNDNMLRLPDRFEIHEWNIMRDFADQQEARAASQLLSAIQGSGAFRRFKATLDHLDLRDDWYEHREKEFRRIAKAWLDGHGIACDETEFVGSAPEPLSTTPVRDPVEALYREIVAGWNALDAKRIAAAFTPTSIMIGYDGSEMRGAAEIEAGMSAVFRDHRPGRWVAIIRDVQHPTADVAILRADAGWFMSPEPESFPQAVQMVVALREGERWSIALLQTTPAALHGRPEAASALAAELRAATRAMSAV